MSDHITRLLEENAVSRLSPENLSIIRTHIKDCPDCRQAYEAAQVAADLLQVHASQTAAPSPFFTTRVMAAIGEQANADRSLWIRFWKAMRLPISAMVGVVLLLLAVTFFYRPLPGGPSPPPPRYTPSADHAIFRSGAPP